MTTKASTLMTILMAFSTGIPAATALAQGSASTTVAKSKVQDAINRFNKATDENEKEIIRGQLRAMSYTTNSPEEKALLSDFFNGTHTQTETLNDRVSRHSSSVD